MATNPRSLASGMNSASSSWTKLDERRLMERVAEGNEQSLLTIYDRYSSHAYRIAFHVLHNPSAAEDMVQEIFLLLWREPTAFDCERGSLSAWIAINARHRSVDYWRKHRREAQVSDQMHLVEPATSLCEYFQDIERVRAILSSLPASQRDVLELSYFGGFSHSEIASQTGLPLGTVKSSIRQALRKVREQLLPHPVNRGAGKNNEIKKTDSSYARVAPTQRQTL